MAEATQATGPAQSAGTPGSATLDAAVAAELEAMEATPEQAEGEPQEQEQEQEFQGQEGDDEQQEGDEQGDEAEQEQQQVRLREGEVEYTTEGGEKYALPKEVADNMLRHQDYTQNMQRLGNIAREQEQAGLQLRELFQTGEHLSAHRARLNQIDEAEGMIHSFLEQNPNLSQTDELEFNKAVAQLNLLQHHRRTSQDAMQKAQHEHATFEATQTAQRVARVMPVFQQMGVSMQHLKAVESHCKAMGLSQDAISFLNEAREPAAIVMAMESMAYRSLMAQKAKGVQQVKQAKGSGVLRPGNSTGGNPRMSNVAQTNQRLKTTGSVKDAVANELAHMNRGNNQRGRMR